MEFETLEKKLKDAGIAARRNLLGSSLTTFAIGGPLSCLIEPNSLSELKAALRAASEEGIPWRVLGNGSNLLLPSAGLNCCVIKLGAQFRYLKPAAPEEGLFEVGGAYPLMTLSRELSELGFAGLEFAGGIPGSLGGATRMNAGAFGGQICDVLISLGCVDTDGNAHVMNRDELTVGYRENSLPKDWVIHAATIRLEKGDPQQILERRARYLAERRAKQPLTFPSAGSIFRNPSRDKSAGYLIEQVGLKGKKIGAAVISTQHANWILNPEKKATDQNVLDLMNVCRERVKEAFSIELRPEIAVWR